MKRGERWKGREREGEERRRRRERGSCVLDISDGHWASICRTRSVMSLGGNLCLPWLNFVHDIASKRYVFFFLKNRTFHLNRTLFSEGPNKVKKFSSFHEHHFFPKKTTGS